MIPAKLSRCGAVKEPTTSCCADIEELQASGKSLMPEGLEQRLSVQDVADVLSFLTLPERRLLEQP